MTRCTDGSCKCEDFDQNNYPGCEHTNFHYWKWCVKKGGCCVPDEERSYVCVDDLTEIECEALGGLYQGDGTICAEIDCEQAIPTLSEWGMIIFGVLLLGFITWVFLRRRKAVAVSVVEP